MLKVLSIGFLQANDVWRKCVERQYQLNRVMKITYDKGLETEQQKMKTYM